MKAFLIPGFTDDLKSKNYQAILDVYTSFGFEPVFVPIDWKYKTLIDWIEQAKSLISKTELEDSLLSGFSYGAMISLSLAAEHQSPKKLLLFSLSPYYSDDISSLKTSWLKNKGSSRLRVFKDLDFAHQAANIKCPTFIFFGGKESQQLKRRAKIARAKIKKSRLIKVIGVKHDLTDPKYIKSLEQTLVTKI